MLKSNQDRNLILDQEAYQDGVEKLEKAGYTYQSLNADQTEVWYNHWTYIEVILYPSGYMVETRF